MSQYPFTPLCMSAVRNGVPLPDWDQDTEHWAMQGTAEEVQYKQALQELRDAMDAVDAESPCANCTLKEMSVPYGAVCLECKHYEDCGEEDDVDYGDPCTICKAIGSCPNCPNVKENHEESAVVPVEVCA